MPHLASADAPVDRYSDERQLLDSTRLTRIYGQRWLRVSGPSEQHKKLLKSLHLNAFGTYSVVPTDTAKLGIVFMKHMVKCGKTASIFASVFLLMAVASCGSPATSQAPNADPSEDAGSWGSASPTTASAPSVSSTAPAPEPSVGRGTIAGSISLKDIDGYTATAKYQILFGAGNFSADPTNSKPGQTQIVQRPGVATMTVTNTTPSRVFPHAVHLAPMALYPVGSQVCLALAPEDQVSKFSDKYCYLYIGEPQANMNGIAPKEIPAGETVKLATSQLDFLGENPLQIATINEDLKAEFLASLGNPAKVVVGVNMYHVVADGVNLCGWGTVAADGTPYGTIHAPAPSQPLCADINGE